MRNITENYNIVDNKISLGYNINNDAGKHSRCSSNVSDVHPHAPLLTQQQQQQQKI